LCVEHSGVRWFVIAQKTAPMREQNPEIIVMKQNRSFALLICFVILGVGAAVAYTRYSVGENVQAVVIGVVVLVNNQLSPRFSAT
jgi:hypothetical protein